MTANWILAILIFVLVAFGLVVQTRLAGTVPPLGPYVTGVVAGLTVFFACGNGRLVRWLSPAPSGSGEGPRVGTWIAWVLALALMVVLLVFGHRYRGGLYLPGRLNPSEVVKPLMVVFGAGFLCRIIARGRLGTVPGKKGTGTRTVMFNLLVYSALTGGVCLAGVLAGDMGFVAQIVLLWLTMVWMVSIGWGLLASGAVGGALLLLAAHPIGHAASRFAVWRDLFSDVTGQGWQTLQGITALLNGGWTGSGFGCGEVERVPIVASDFVYAAVGEDLGFAGCAVVIGLWGALFMCGLLIAWRCWREGEGGEATSLARGVDIDKLAKVNCAALLAVGVVTSLFVQVFLNVSGVLNVLPMTGITLPFISLGGSSFVATMILCALLMAIATSNQTIRRHGT